MQFKMRLLKKGVNLKCPIAQGRSAQIKKLKKTNQIVEFKCPERILNNLESLRTQINIQKTGTSP